MTDQPNQNSSMNQSQYSLRFNTPAFLGDADQNGRWRTPPFKALLRQWWRVAWAKSNDYSKDIDRLRRHEGRLFGSAADGTGNRSLVRLRLDRWDRGQMTRWEEDPKVRHKEVGEKGAMVGSHLYLGFGPLNFNQGTFLGKKEGRDFKPRAAVQSGEIAKLRIAFPSDESRLLDFALALMDAYGAIGGRSRNGWGSFALKPTDGTLLLDGLPIRDWRKCLDRDWPHAIGCDDDAALIWQTGPYDDWHALMRQLAEIKIGLRTQFKFHSGRNVERPEPRHWLSYPVTNHNVRQWGQGRLPNSLRFKVRATENGKLRGAIFHIPCLPPRQFRPEPDRDAIERVWQQVHAHLDGQNDLKRIDK